MWPPRPMPFWENLNENASSMGFVVIGHRAEQGGYGRQDHHLSTVDQSSGVAQYRISLYVEGRASTNWAGPGTCEALSVENVPVYFPYRVFGADWIAAHGCQCRLQASKSLHEISGTVRT